MIGLPTSPALDVTMENEERNRLLIASVSELPWREAKILTVRYGLGGGDPKTMTATAAMLRISPATVSYIERRAIRLIQMRGAKGGAGRKRLCASGELFRHVRGECLQNECRERRPDRKGSGIDFRKEARYETVVVYDGNNKPISILTVVKHSGHQFFGVR